MSDAQSASGGGDREFAAQDREDLRAYREGKDLTAGGQYGPLGAGHAPAKDPLKGLRGVMAGTLVMQSISVLLGLTVVTRVAGGQLNETFSITYISILGIALFVMAFLQKRRWALAANIVLQVFGILAVFTHVSMGFVGVFFAVVWMYILHLRKNLIQRMERGLLTTQHT
ncbi:DUF4233 domain-containing protein [Corynebacterium lactis]|uniref:Membrane protein n=1 Tax=Corynebacterium lactis RW2-5 TaxID=1408189 RepID=A0A0K2GZP1_9CORY|nr:DUF4233 domain-containing protein [Corynebacterium lactis]ALA66951.1 membrane protein [Corynebacterium lactis RW2-5]